MKVISGSFGFGRELWSLERSIGFGNFHSSSIEAQELEFVKI